MPDAPEIALGEARPAQVMQGSAGDEAPHTIAEALERLIAARELSDAVEEWSQARA